MNGIDDMPEYTGEGHPLFYDGGTRTPVSAIFGTRTKYLNNSLVRLSEVGGTCEYLPLFTRIQLYFMTFDQISKSIDDSGSRLNEFFNLKGAGRSFN